MSVGTDTSTVFDAIKMQIFSIVFGLKNPNYQPKKAISMFLKLVSPRLNKNVNIVYFHPKSFFLNFKYLNIEGGARWGQEFCRSTTNLFNRKYK